MKTINSVTWLRREWMAKGEVWDNSMVLAWDVGVHLKSLGMGELASRPTDPSTAGCALPHPILTFCPQSSSLALSCWPYHSIIPIPAAQLGALLWWSSSLLSSPPCCHLPYPIVVVLALIAVPSLPLCGSTLHSSTYSCQIPVGILILIGISGILGYCKGGSGGCLVPHMSKYDIVVFSCTVGNV